MTMSVLEKTLSKKTFSLPERVPQSLGLAPGAWSKLPSAEAGSPHRGHCANIALSSGCCCCCRTISADQRLGAGREKSPPIPQVPRLLLVASVSTIDSQESLPLVSIYPYSTLPWHFLIHHRPGDPGDHLSGFQHFFEASGVLIWTEPEL